MEGEKDRLWLPDPEETLLLEEQWVPATRRRSEKKRYAECELCRDHVRKKAITKHHYWWERKSFESISADFKLVKYRLCLDCHAGYHMNFLRNCMYRTACIGDCPFRKICCYHEINKVARTYGIETPLYPKIIVLRRFTEIVPHIAQESVEKFTSFGHAEKIPENFLCRLETGVQSI